MTLKATGMVPATATTRSKMVATLTTPQPAAVATLLDKMGLQKKVADAARDALTAGTDYTVDGTFRIRGTMHIGHDEEKTHYAAVPWAGLLAVALSKLNGVTVEALLREAVKGRPSTASVKKAAEQAVQTVVGGTQKVFRGKVTTDLQVDVVSAAVLTSE